VDLVVEVELEVTERPVMALVHHRDLLYLFVVILPIQ